MILPLQIGGGLLTAGAILGWHTFTVRNTRDAIAAFRFRVSRWLLAVGAIIMTFSWIMS